MQAKLRALQKRLAAEGAQAAGRGQARQRAALLPCLLDGGGKGLGARPLAVVGRGVGQALGVLPARDGARLGGRVHARHGGDDVAGQLIGVGVPLGEPVAGGVEALDGGVDVGVAVRVVPGESQAVEAEPAAVGAALHADLVPQVVQLQDAAGNLPGTVALDAGCRAVGAGGDEGGGAGDGKGLVLDGGIGNAQQVAGVVCHRRRERQVARRLPERGGLVVGAGKAHPDVVGAEDRARQLRELGHEPLEARVEVVQQLAQEQVVVDARDLLGKKVGSREVRGHA